MAEELRRIKCGEPCVVTGAPGGYLGSHIAQGVDFRRRGVKMVIDGDCLSACTVVADINHENVCVTERGRLGFHKGKLFDPDQNFQARFDIKYSDRIHGWLLAHGGQPVRGWVYMTHPETLNFFRACRRDE